jgi:fermentation-respiration switch protein FrsA (DUF1100 family)
MRQTSVVLDSEGCLLSATIRIPDGSPPFPSIVFTGPLSTVRDQAVDLYAELLVEQGFLTLTFDHRNFGTSGGLPRQHEDPAGKLADLRTAVTTLRERQDVDPARITLCGLSLGAGYALRAAAIDPRVAAVVAVAGAFNSPLRMMQLLGPGPYRELLLKLLSAAHHTNGEPAYMPVVTADHGPAMIAGDEQYSYYMTGRGRSQHWVNRITTASAYQLLTFDTLSAAELIAPTPVLVVHGRKDDYCSPELARTVFDRVDGPKQLVWLDTDCHVDLYTRPSLVADAVDAIASFLARHRR